MKQVNLKKVVETAKEKTKDIILDDTKLKVALSSISGAFATVTSIAAGNGVCKALRDGIKWFSINYVLESAANYAIDSVADRVYTVRVTTEEVIDDCDDVDDCGEDGEETQTEN